MKIVIAHNRYAVPGIGSGEEKAVDTIASILKEKGHSVYSDFKCSSDISRKRSGKVKAFFSGIYNFQARREFKKVILTQKPNLILVQNVFPLFSPSILSACHDADIPVMMRCPNYRLICPNGLFLRHGEICELCSGGKEYWCIFTNCMGNLSKSLGYGLRGYIASGLSLFKKNVDAYLVLTEFSKKKLIQNGFSSDSIRVVSGSFIKHNVLSNKTSNGDYAGYVGRISPEKGINTLISAAKILPDIPFKVAGHFEIDSVHVKQAPENIEFLGQLNAEQLCKFYTNSRIVVVPSKCYEGLPNVIIEAMLSIKPVVCSNIGGLSEIVEEGKTGLLFRHDDFKDLARKIDLLWNDTDLCLRLGYAGKEKAEREYNPDRFYQRFMDAYESVLEQRSKKKDFPVNG